MTQEKKNWDEQESVLTQNGAESLKQVTLEEMQKLAYQLDLNTTRVEQSAFDSINSTDQVMLRLQDTMQAMNEILQTQSNLLNAIELYSLSMGEEEGNALLQLSRDQAQNLQNLEHQFHQVAEAGIEANDAVHCIEEGIAQQNSNVSDLIDLTQKVLGNQ